MSFKQQKIYGWVKVQVALPPLPADSFYARIKKRTGAKRTQLAEVLHVPQKKSQSHHRSYTVGYKLQVLSYWYASHIKYGSSKFREPTVREVGKYINIPVGNLHRWRKDEKEDKFAEAKQQQRRLAGGGRPRQWQELERELYEDFEQWRAIGRPIRRS